MIDPELIEDFDNRWGVAFKIGDKRYIKEEYYTDFENEDNVTKTMSPDPCKLVNGQLKIIFFREPGWKEIHITDRQYYSVGVTDQSYNEALRSFKRVMHGEMFGYAYRMNQGTYSDFLEEMILKNWGEVE